MLVALTMGELISAFPMSGGMYWSAHIDQRPCTALAGIYLPSPLSDSLLPMLLQVDCNPGSAKQGPQPGALLQLACM